MHETMLEFDERSVKEKPMVELAYYVMKQAKETFNYQDLVQQVFKMKGLPEEDLLDFTVRLYTELNIDGRFAFLGQNQWGLKQWYPADQLDTVHFNHFIDDDEEEVVFDNSAEEDDLLVADDPLAAADDVDEFDDTDDEDEDEDELVDGFIEEDAEELVVADEEDEID
ncbi:DNA-directed RNA polymerase subunit delta [Tepidibacillus marianensis]|uniref:DNA-directed RNA polymerase subunit delta n=1 Tax=Tepidibacillus marianensis TaxID=3131995 RepID=UPI0030CB81CD